MRFRILAVAVALALPACGGDATGPSDIADAELTVQVTSPTGELFAPGTHTLELSDVRRDPIVYVPAGHDPSSPAPLVVLFHGAGGSAENWQSPYTHADRLGLVLLIMQSRLVTWDMMQGGFGPDVETLDRALAQLFDHVAIDPDAVAFAGFSDGASYAITLTMVNSGLVRKAVGFSPGGIVPVERQPLPGFFISHGSYDQILPVENTRRLVTALANNGFDTRYLEFAGTHEVPPNVSTAAFDWIVEGR